jgi:ubiquinone/menaquinone biosynthesis C-methylase UbiE
MDDNIYFYGTDNPKLFQIERNAMDRQGKVISFLESVLPKGRILDIGAGNGHTGSRLAVDRQMVCAEPSPTLPDFSAPVTWVQATAETLPFHDGYFDAAYSTWAYFLPGVKKDKGLAEVGRVVKKGGLFVVIDNAGMDEFTSFSGGDISTDAEFYQRNGFESQIIKTSFDFDDLDEAETLMTAFFGKERMSGQIKKSYSFNVVAYSKVIEAGAQQSGPADGSAAADL